METHLPVSGSRIEHSGGVSKTHMLILCMLGLHKDFCFSFKERNLTFQRELLVGNSLDVFPFFFHSLKQEFEMQA